MAPRERGGQGQAAGGRGGGRGPHSGGRGFNPNAAAAKKVQDNGNAPEKSIQQQQQQSHSGSVGAAEPAKQGPWGTSFKDKLMAPKQEAAPAQPAVSAPAARELTAKPAANGPESAKPSSPEALITSVIPAPSGPRPYAAAVTAPVPVGAADNGSDIQFGSFMEGEVAQGKEPAAPQGPLPTAVPAAVEAVRQQSRQVIRTNSAPASANPAQEGQRDTPVFVPAKLVRAAQQPTRMGVSIPEGGPAAQPSPQPSDNISQTTSAASAPVAPVGSVPALAPAREVGQPRQAPMQQPSQQDRQSHPRQGGHDRQPHPTGQLPVAHTGGMPIPQDQPAGPGPVQHHTGPRHPQQHHIQLAPQQAFAPGPGVQPPQSMHHQLQQQSQQPGAQGGGRRGGQAHQQVPVQMAVPVPGGFPQAAYGMPSYAAQATQPVPMPQPQHGYPAVQHPPVGGAGTGQHGMGGPLQQYLAGSPSQFQPYMFSTNPVMGTPLGGPPITVPVMVPVPAHPHSHHPHAAGAPHILASSPTLSVGFHVPGPQQHAPPPANYGTPPNVPQPAPITIPIPSAGAGAGSSAPNAPVAAAAQAAINATNAAAPVSAVPTVVPTVPPPHPPTATPTPAPAPLQGPGAGAVGGSSVSTAGLPSVAPGSAAQPKAVATPPPQPAKKVLQILDPKSHERVVLSGAAGSTDGKNVEGGLAGATSAGAKPVATPAAPPPRRPLVIKEPTVKPKTEPKLAAEPKQSSEMSLPKPPEPVEGAATAQPAGSVDTAQQPNVAHPSPSEVQGSTMLAEAPAKSDDVPAPVSAPDAPAMDAALPPKQPSSFQIDVADEEETEVPATSSIQTAAASIQEDPSTADGVAHPAVAIEEAAIASVSGVTSGSGSGDDTAAAGSSGASIGTRKKNLKQAIRDADAKGANNDLLSAFREPAPPPKAEAADAVKPKEMTASEESRTAPAPAHAEEVTEHWEERADEAAAGEASSSAAAGTADTRHRYSRDYLMSIGKQIIMPLLVPLDSYHQQCIGLDSPQDNTRGGVVGMLNRAGSREVDWGRRDDRGRGGDFRGDIRGDRGGGGMGGDRRDRDGMRGGGPSGRGGTGSGMDRRGSANIDDGWQRRPPPPPSPGGDMRGGGSRGMSRQGSGTAAYGVGAGPVNLHKTENRWQAGISTAEDPEEEKKQKTFKGILNKLTPDNYDKLKQQILAVPITHQKTLEGFINQIFDKALIETTFSEMYANLCKEIHPSLPQFPSNDPNNQKPVDFRRLLLNKCQQEFEDGVAAMKKVKEREEHNKEEAEKEKQGKEKAASLSADNGKLEEGEIPGASTGLAASTEDARVKALAEAAEAERELKARRRMLGNIQFIGQLYKCGLLTDRIIHSCIVQLLNDELSPRPDDIECLCKLLTTLGKQLEEQVNKKGAANGNPLDVYFQRMERLRKGSNLDSRIKFAIQDVLDLRAARWVSRRKVEGPKRIEEVHREAQQQMAAQASRDREERYAQQRGPGVRGGPGMGGRDAPPPPGRFGGPSQDEARLMGRGEVAKPLRGAGMERQASSEVSLRPSSFLAIKRTGSPAQPGGVVAVATASAREAAAAAARVQAAAVASVAPTPIREERSAPPPPAGMSEEAARKKGASWVKELYEVKEKAAAADSLAGFKAAGAHMGAVLAAALREAFEVRGIDMANRLDFLKEVLVEQLTSTEGVLNSSMLEDAFGRFMGELDTWYEDNPKAAGVAAKAVGQLAAQGHISLGPCLRPILDAKGLGGGGDDDDGGAASDLPPLVESGVAGQHILGNVLQAACDAGGAEKAAELWRASGLEASRFFDMPEDVETLTGKFTFLSG
ncbi:hypothetical protein Vretifemale_18213 [Volvox reticuliferus]|uniref:MI domain-containing protein n=1 Tax=Volvox reticuliferus TaxID=1737510 RepID=A0A8J4CVF7_9CHLO|nr:hypothetical protein Vretifemale_18213 [Volvox reticuliferus]